MIDKLYQQPHLICCNNLERGTRTQMSYGFSVLRNISHWTVSSKFLGWSLYLLKLLPVTLLKGWSTRNDHLPKLKFMIPAAIVDFSISSRNQKKNSMNQAPTLSFRLYASQLFLQIQSPNSMWHRPSSDSSITSTRMSSSKIRSATSATSAETVVHMAWAIVFYTRSSQSGQAVCPFWEHCSQLLTLVIDLFKVPNFPLWLLSLVSSAFSFFLPLSATFYMYIR